MRVRKPCPYWRPGEERYDTTPFGVTRFLVTKPLHNRAYQRRTDRDTDQICNRLRENRPESLAQSEVAIRSRNPPSVAANPQACICPSCFEPHAR